MRLRLVPGKTALTALAAATAAVLVVLIVGASVAHAAWLASAYTMALLAAGGVDYVVTRRSWQRASPQVSRQLPAALAIGVAPQNQFREYRAVFDRVVSSLKVQG